MSSNESGEENAKMMPLSNNDSEDNLAMDGSEKISELLHSSKVTVSKEGVKDFIDVDIEYIEEGNVYGIEYRGDVYGVEKLSDGKIIFYEAVE